MRIIKQGQKPEDVRFQMTCNHCNTVVEVTKSELLYLEPDRQSVGSSGSHYCNCPTCGQKIFKNLSRDLGY